MRARGGNGRSPSTRTTSTTTTTPIAARGCFQVSYVGFAAHRTPPSQCSSSSLDDDDEMPKHGKPKLSDDMRPIAPLPMPMPMPPTVLPSPPPPPPSAAVADVVVCFVCRCESPNGRSAHDAKVRIVRRCE